MDIKQEIVDSIQVMVDATIKKVCPIITFGIVMSVDGRNKCIAKINNIDYKIAYYGKNSPDLMQKYPIFVPFGKMNLAFIITSGGGSGTIGLIIKGYYATFAELRSAVLHPQVGDTYGVGESEPYDIYVWDSVNSEWVNNGKLKGEQGETGATGNGIASIELVSGTHEAGTFDTYQITFTNGNTTSFQVYNGENGATGNGISSIELISGTHASGTFDTYQIRFTNGNTTNFQVYNGKDGIDGTNGNGIVSVSLISGTHAAGTLDTYQITFTDGDTTNFQVYNGAVGQTGNGISSIELISGTHASGTFDTYQISFTDGNSYNFMVYNGADGLGAGDMLKSIYDKKSLSVDVYGYADGMLGKTTTFNSDGSITEITPLWEKVTTFNSDGSITEKMTYTDTTWREKTTVFNSDGSITETITEG